MALLTMFFGAMAGAPISGESGDEGLQAMTISIVNPPSTAASGAATDSAESFFEKYDVAVDEGVAVPVGRKADRLNSLAERLRQKSDFSQEEASQESAEPADTTQAPQRKSGAPGEGASTGALWGRIEPCWRKQGLAAAVPVTLEVSFDARGRLDKPPRILRAKDAALDEVRLRAEAQAISTLNACLPRNDLRFGGAIHRVEFPAAPLDPK